MTTVNDARKAHKLLDYVSQGRAVLDDEIKLLRSYLPELPNQKTLEEILVDVESAARGVTDNYWSPSTNPQDWLWELHEQLKGLMNTPATKPAHPEFLETEEDYENATEGTIVACEDSPPCHKFGSEWSSILFYEMKDNRGMSRAIRRVLRWGKWAT